MQKLKIIIVDDHKMIRQIIGNHISTENIAEIIADAGTGQEFLDLLATMHPDIVLMNISMPIMNGIEATREALKIYPDVKIIALSAFCVAEYYHLMVEAGAKGFLIKNAGIVELERAINDVAEGGNYFSNELLQNVIFSMKNLPKEIEVLTKREIEILRLICSGLTNDQIADKLNLSSETIKGHRTKILQKTNSKNTAGVVMYAFKHKLISEND